VFIVYSLNNYPAYLHLKLRAVTVWKPLYNTIVVETVYYAACEDVPDNYPGCADLTKACLMYNTIISYHDTCSILHLELLNPSAVVVWLVICIIVRIQQK